MREKILLPHSADHTFSSSVNEYVSWRQKITAFCAFKYENIALVLFVLRNPRTFKESNFNLCDINRLKESGKSKLWQKYNVFS